MVGTGRFSSIRYNVVPNVRDIRVTVTAGNRSEARPRSCRLKALAGLLVSVPVRLVGRWSAILVNAIGTNNGYRCGAPCSSSFGSRCSIEGGGL